MKPVKASVLAVFLLASTCSASVLGSLVVDGKSNIYGAGQAGPPPPGTAPGILPPGFSFASLGGVGGTLTFTSVTGTVNCCGAGAPTANGPDGIDLSPYSIGQTNVASTGGISGLQFTGREMFLVAVFLAAATPPVGPAPSRLTYGAGGDTFASASPTLNQVFFVGDGRTGTGSGGTQQFFIPVGATMLYLGFVDAMGFGAFGPSGGTAGGAYDDNTGSFTAAFLLDVPEPGTALLMAAGLLGLAMRRLKRC